MENKFYTLYNKNDPTTSQDLVDSFEKAYAAIEQLRKNEDRIMATPNNPDSSRGHLFISLKVTFNNEKSGMLHIGDLAGSENPISICKSAYPNQTTDWNTTLRDSPKWGESKEDKKKWKTVRQGFFINESNYHLLSFCRKMDKQQGTYNMEYLSLIHI